MMIMYLVKAKEFLESYQRYIDERNDFSEVTLSTNTLDKIWT